MTIAELERKINNICQIGTVSEVYTTQEPDLYKDYSLLAKVNIMERETAFFPVFSEVGRFKKHFVPLRKGEQVMVLCPFGDADFGYILRGIFAGDEPISNSSKDLNIEKILYEDGSEFLIDTKLKKMEIKTEMDVELKCKNTEVTAESVVITSQSIDLGSIGGCGVVTQNSLCPIIGVPHLFASAVTRSI